MLDAARWAVLAAAAFLPFSTAGTNLAIVLALLAWALSMQWRATARAIAHEPAAWTGWLLFAALAAAMAWSLAPEAQAAATLWKYRELLFFGVVMFLFADLRWRQRLLWVFFGAALVLLAVSYAAWSGLVQAADAEQAASQGAVMNKSSITHSFMMSLLAFVAAMGALRMRNWPRAVFAVIALLAAINVLAAVPGRTGYVVLAALAVFLAVRRWRWKGVAGAMVGLLVIAAAAYQWVPSFAARLDQTVAETREYQAAPRESSMGFRLHYLKRSLQAVAERPLVGAGTGGWGEAFYEATVNDPPFLHDRRHTHPHNEYLHLAVQLGLGGLLLFAGMLGVALWRTRVLPEPERLLAQGVVVAFAVGCLFNDFILDSTEGHIWAVLGGALFGANVRREPWRARS
jgi:O-antigen ligase